MLLRFLAAHSLTVYFFEGHQLDTQQLNRKSIQRITFSPFTEQNNPADYNFNSSKIIK